MDIDIKKKTFLNFVGLLRSFLIKCFIGIVLCSSIAFLYTNFIFEQILFAPKNPNFPIYIWHRSLIDFFNLSSSLYMEGIDFDIQNRKMDGQLMIMIWTSFTFGLIASFPWILYQIWKLVQPKLYNSKTRYSIVFVTITSLLFFIGVLFGYFIIVPLSIHFFMNIEISSIVANQIDLTSYISLVRTTILASGIVFVLPVVILVLYKMGILSTDTLKGYRRYAYVLILVASAIITPPDVLSQVILVIPLVLLYEVSIFFSKFMKSNHITE